MLAVKSRPVFTAAAALFLITTFCLLHPEQSLTPAFFLSFTSSADIASATGGGSGAEKPWGKAYRGHSEPEDINRVTNATLGFGKVFVVGMPERTDKRDAMALASSLTGFDVEWVDGVRGEDVSNKAVPFRVDRKKLTEANLGQWRGHMNAVRRILEEDLDSALIMEDDMDWDVRLKPQLELAASGARAILSTLPDGLFPHGRASASASSSPSQQSPASPYGDDWDVLWLGHCGEPFPEDLPENQALPDTDPGFQAMARKWTILGDATVPPPGRLTGLVDYAAHGPPRTRWVHVSAAPICSFAYALSRAGARKVLYDLGVGVGGSGSGGATATAAAPFDNALAGLCRRAVTGWSGVLAGNGAGDDGGLAAKCVSVTPPLFFHHRAQGLSGGDGDVEEERSGGASEGEEVEMPEVREKGSTENIVWSTRLNLENLIAGREMEDQWGDV